MREYTNRDRAFLQAILARGTITFDEARPVLAAILNADTGEEDEIRPDQITEEAFMEQIDIASEAASLFDYEIRSTVHQVTKKRMYALVNTTSDPQTQLATTYAPDELAFIKRALDAMFEKYNTPRMEVLAITEMQAIKLARPDRRLSQTQTQTQIDVDAQTQTPVDRGLKHSEVETVMANLVGGGWFEKSVEGFFSLSPKALLELRPWLIETYNDPDLGPQEWQRIKFCEACKSILTVGLRCANVDCSLRIHDICEEAFWRTQRDKKCPRCSTEWTGKRYAGERAVTMTEAYQRGRRRTSGGRRSALADDVIREEGGANDAGEESGEESDAE